MDDKRLQQKGIANHRRSVRMKGFDYAAEGMYAITICSEGRHPIFGEVHEGEMSLSEIGLVVKEEWEKTPILRSSVELGAFVIMPNHFHAIVYILESRNSEQREKMRCSPTGIFQIEQFGRPTSSSILTIVRCFKAAVTRKVNEKHDRDHLTIWQRNYYEHVIKSDEEFNRIERYILENPMRWLEDDENV
jgi:putative transposase